MTGEGSRTVRTHVLGRKRRDGEELLQFLTRQAQLYLELGAFISACGCLQSGVYLGEFGPQFLDLGLPMETVVEQCDFAPILGQPAMRVDDVLGVADEVGEPFDL
ncbi:hypothetical protein [Nonomuraea sp. NPDC050202]|uniref:hypothetical protein n=1 Tax=Nonomuraea sp. NPDC050202 TaxID=3155035 RepID=UPI0033F89874